MYPHQAERLSAALEGGALDALVASSPANVAYVTGFWSLARAVQPATEIYAVGGRELLVSNGSAWSRAAIDANVLVNDLNGVSCFGGRVVVVGGGSLKLRRAGSAWESDFGSEPLTDLHGAWADESGAFWGAGGQFTASARPGASRHGVIGRFAEDLVPTTLER